MKLSPIQKTEATVKHTFALKVSTTEALHRYQELYKKTLQSEVSLKDLVEQMLVDFMVNDKDFQKHLKAVATPVSSKGAKVTPGAEKASGSADI